MNFFQPSRALTDTELQAAFTEHCADVRSELQTEGCPQPDIDKISDLQSLVGVKPYSTLFADLRRLRFGALLEWRDKQSPGNRAGTLRDLALRESDLSGASGTARLALERAIGDLQAGKNVEKQILGIITDMWRDDAAVAVEQRQVQQVVRRLVTSVVVFFLLIICFQQLTDILYTYIHGNATIDAFRDTTRLIGNLIASKWVMCSLFGLVGAVFSIWLDKNFTPPLPHWIVLRRSARRTRCWGGIIVGLLVSVLAPVLLGEEFAQGNIKVAALSASGSNPTPQPETDAGNTILRLYAFSLALGFSQDVFFKKVRAFGGE
ncbi:MAG TPA: hypothetical protein VMQ61_14925 [Thermoanaerobaculia bacterium]|nr:hypothetical protein [Thermoanaerobaculia bacterium]